MKKRTTKAAAFLAAAGLILAACGDSDSSSETSAPAGDSDGVCPSNLVIQTDWYPEIEHGGTYQLIGPGGTADSKLYRYSGPIAEKYKVGGIETVEIRAGGDGLGDVDSVLGAMQLDEKITLGYVNTDDIIQTAGKIKGIGVAATLEINPQMLMWNPDELDIDPKDPASLGTSGARISHFSGTTYMDWLKGKGFIDASQSDPSYVGSEDQFIANKGNFVQQGFVSNEKFKYENIVKWKDKAPAPIGYLLIHDLGWQPYPAMYTVLQDQKDDLNDCLKVLVPVLQQAWVDYLDNPQAVSDELVKITDAYNTFWKVTPELNTEGFKIMGELGISSNGPDSTYGNFDLDRVKKLYDEAMPLLEELGVETFDPTLKLEDVVTNEYIDTSIGR
jgi:hypothetical protein